MDARSRRSGRFRMSRSDHHHFGADPNSIVEVDHVLVHHADAARGDRLADGVGFVGAVDAIKRGTEVHGARAERVGGSTRHEARQVGTALQHLRGRTPIRTLALNGNLFETGPLEAGSPYADPIAQGGPATLDQVKELARRIDHDGAGRMWAAPINDLPVISGVQRPPNSNLFDSGWRGRQRGDARLARGLRLIKLPRRSDRRSI